MEESNRRWIIRDATGQIDGPFTTEKVLYKIGRGEFSGDESIANYPSGKWIPISQDPQFYDKLLEVLSASEDQEAEVETRVLEFTRPQNTEIQDLGRKTATDVDLENTEVPSPEEDATSPGGEEPAEEKALVPLGNASRARRTRKKHKDIEMVDTRPALLQELLKRGKLPVLIGVTALLAGASLFFLGNTSNEERIHLIAPQKNIPQVSAEKLKSRLAQAGADFRMDTFEGYIHAENQMVYIVERDKQNHEVMGLLCLTYLELWPYSHQDSADTKTISTLVQMSSAVDPAGNDSATCRAVDLTVRARFQEAKSLVEAMLDARSNVDQPPILFYYLKGFLLEGTADHASAIGYLRSAEQLSPQWVLPYVTDAQALTKMEKYGDAVQMYRRVLQMNPSHTVARIELGLLEYKYFNHYDLGEQLLKQALDSDAAPLATLSRGYLGLAEIALKRGDQKRALKYAKKSHSLNSSYTAANNLIVQLAGVDVLRSTVVKGQQLLFEGDQFLREGDFQAAQAHYKAAFEQDPKNGVAALKAAQALWRLSFSTEAIEWLGKAIHADPNLIEAYVTMADYQAQRYNFLAAIRILESAKSVSPKSSEVFRGFALVELKRGNAQGAITFGKMALKLYENDVETQILLAKASLAVKDYKMAYNYAAKAIEIDVNHRKAQIVYAEALAGLQGIDVGEAYFLQLVNNYPLVTEYRLALGKMLLADERFQQAEEIFRQIIKLDEKPKEAYVELAKVLRAQGNAGEALDLLLKAAVLDPADAEPLYIAGAIYLDIKKPQEAAVQFQRVLTINKLYPLVHYQLGRAALMRGDPSEALSQTDAEKQANPNLADAFLLAADAQAQLQQFGLCATEYQKAIKLRPQSASIYVKIASCYRRAGNLDAATAMLNVAATKESGLADIYKEQGAIYELKGDLSHAIEAYQQYFVLDPDAQDREQLEGRISALQRGQTP